MALDRENPTPLYYQLAQLVRARIRAGEIAVGDRLPSERELSQQFGISRMTVRQAIAYLEREGVVKTQHGVGTIVDEPRLVYDVALLFGFAEEVAFDHGRAHAKVLRQEIGDAPPQVALALHLQPSDKVLCLERLRIYKDIPVIMETNYIRASLCPGLETENLHANSLTFLRKKYNLLGSHARHHMEATAAGDKESSLLEIPMGAPLLLTEGETYGEDGQPMEYFRVLYRGDRFQFEFRTDGATTLKLR